jgi:hypothetical protein
VRDAELIDTILECRGLTEREREAFESMRDWLDQGEGRGLSAKRREWALAVATAQNLVAEETQNLWSEGKVPRGIVTKKTRGEEAAAKVLANRPSRPPRRGGDHV